MSFSLPSQAFYVVLYGRVFQEGRIGYQAADADVGARPAGECTCDRATTENQKVDGETCRCGMRAKSRSTPSLINLSLLAAHAWASVASERSEPEV